MRGPQPTKVVVSKHRPKTVYMVWAMSASRALHILVSLRVDRFVFLVFGRRSHAPRKGQQWRLSFTSKV